jgi:hypothetical protein
MQVGELFVAIGVKGTEKTISAFNNVQKGIGEVKKVSLETKAAILGAIYALEKLMSSSAQKGQDLGALSGYLGDNVKVIQQLEYAAQQAGISVQEFRSSLMSLYQAIGNIRAGEGAPKWFSFFAQSVGGFDIEKAYVDREYVLKKIQQFARMNFSGDELILRNKALEGFGLSPDFIGKLHNKDVFTNPYQFKAPIYSEGQVKSLGNVSVGWENLKTKWEVFFGKFTADKGEKIVTNLTKLSDALIKLATALGNLLEKTGAIDLLQKLIDWTIIILDTLGYYLNKNVNDVKKSEEVKKTEEKSLFKEALKLTGTIIKEELFNNNEKDYRESLSNLFNFSPNQSGIITPPTPLLPSQARNTTSASVNQNIYFQHAGNDYNRVKDSMKQVILDTWNQLPPHVWST